MFYSTNELMIKFSKLKCANFHYVFIRIKKDDLDNNFKEPKNNINNYNFFKLIKKEVGV